MDGMNSFNSEGESQFNHPRVRQLYKVLEETGRIDIPFLKSLDKGMEDAMKSKVFDIYIGNYLGPVTRLLKEYQKITTKDIPVIVKQLGSISDLFDFLKKEPTLIDLWNKSENISDLYYTVRFSRLIKFFSKIPEDQLKKILQMLKKVENDQTLTFYAIALGTLDTKADFVWALEKLMDYKYCLHVIRISECFDSLGEMNYRLGTLTEVFYDVLKVYYHFSVFYKRDDSPVEYKTFLTYDRMYNKILKELPRNLITAQFTSLNILDNSIDNFFYVNSRKGDLSIPSSSMYTYGTWFVEEFKRILDPGCVISADYWQMEKSLQVEFKVFYPGYNVMKKIYNKDFANSFISMLTEEYLVRNKDSNIINFGCFIKDILDCKHETGSIDFYLNYCYYLLSEHVDNMGELIEGLNKEPNLIWESLIYVCSCINKGDKAFLAIMKTPHRMTLLRVIKGIVGDSDTCFKSLIRALTVKFSGDIAELNYLLDTVDDVYYKIKLEVNTKSVEINMSAMVSNYRDFLQSLPINTLYKYKVRLDNTKLGKQVVFYLKRGE